MVRNADGLKRSARSRSEDATQRATAAILLMQAEELEINLPQRRSACEGIDGLALRNEVPTGQDHEDSYYRAGGCGRESATSAAALARTSRGNSPTAHSDVGRNQSRAARATRSSLR